MRLHVCGCKSIRIRVLVQLCLSSPLPCHARLTVVLAFLTRPQIFTTKAYATRLQFRLPGCDRALFGWWSESTSQDTRQQLEVQAPSSCSLSGTAKTICQARVNQYCCSDPVGNAFHESNGWWMTNSISSCVGLARKRRKPQKARKGNESAEANTRSAEARGSAK